MRVFGEFGFWFAVLGGLVAAPAVISLIYRLTSPELAPVLLEFVTFYRDKITDVVDVLFEWTEYRPPAWLVDLYAVNTIVMVALLRDEFFDPDVEGNPQIVGGFLLLLFLPVAWIWALIDVTVSVFRHRFDYSVFYMSLLVSFLAAAAFFAVNKVL